MTGSNPPGPFGQQGSYGQQGNPYGQNPYGQNPHGQQPYGGDPSQYAPTQMAPIPAGTFGQNPPPSGGGSKKWLWIVVAVVGVIAVVTGVGAVWAMLGRDGDADTAAPVTTTASVEATSSPASAAPTAGAPGTSGAATTSDTEIVDYTKAFLADFSTYSPGNVERPRKAYNQVCTDVPSANANAQRALAGLDQRTDTSRLVGDVTATIATSGRTSTEVPVNFVLVRERSSNGQTQTKTVIGVVRVRPGADTCVIGVESNG